MRKRPPPTQGGLLGRHPYLDNERAPPGQHAAVSPAAAAKTGIKKSFET